MTWSCSQVSANYLKPISELLNPNRFADLKKSIIDLALDKISQIELKYQINPNLISSIKHLINNNINQCLFQQTVAHILLLDNLRGEKLFDLWPFKSLAVDNILRNHEYE